MGIPSGARVPLAAIDMSRSSSRKGSRKGSNLITDIAASSWRGVSAREPGTAPADMVLPHDRVILRPLPIDARQTPHILARPARAEGSPGRVSEKRRTAPDGRYVEKTFPAAWLGPRPCCRGRLQAGENAVQGGDAFSGRPDVEHNLLGVRPHRPVCPEAALVLHGDELAPFFPDAGLAAEGDAKTPPWLSWRASARPRSATTRRLGCCPSQSA